MLADRAQIEHRIKSRDLVDLDTRHFQHIRDIIHRRTRQPVVALALGDIEQWNNRACLPPRRIFGDDLLRSREGLGGEGKTGRLFGRDIHRSISPNTMSMLPTMATASASMWPLHIKSVPCRCAKPGARILQRYGRLVPSETRYTANSPL